MYKEYTKSKLNLQQEENKKSAFVQHLTAFKPLELEVLNEILRVCSKFETNYISQTTIANRTSLSRKTVNKYVQKFEDLGFFLCERRHLQTNLYWMHNILYDSQFRLQISSFLPSFKYFALAALLVTTVTQANSINFIDRLIDDKKEKITTEKVINHQTLIYESPPTQWVYRDDEFERWLEQEKSRKKPMMPFTQEELNVIAAFPQDVVATAHKRLTKELLSGKVIGNQFNYFVAICKNEIAKKENPEMGKTQAAKQTTVYPPSVAWKQSPLSKDQYNRKVAIYNRQVKLYNGGYEYRNLSYGELYAMCTGQIPRKPLPMGTPPPEEPVYEESTILFWEDQPVTNPHAFSITSPLPVLGNHQTSAPENQETSQEIFSEDLYEQVFD